MLKKEELLEILMEINDDIDYATETRMIDDGHFDSFDIITLISEIAEEFDIRIPADKIVPENFNSLNSIYDLLVELEAN